MKHIPTFSTILLLFVFSCNDSTHKKLAIASNERIDKTEILTEITALPIVKKSFSKEIITNGKVIPVNETELYFNSSGFIQKVMIYNGIRVNMGDTLAQLDNRKQVLELEISKNNLKRAEIELNSLLLGYIGKNSDTSMLDRRLLDNLKTQSGFISSQTLLKKARLDFENSFLISPAEGIIAGLEVGSYSRIGPNDKICILINNSRYHVKFDILETEICKVKPGQQIRAIPFSNTQISWMGMVKTIDPMVNKNGTVKVSAELKNPVDQIFSGQNTKVIIEQILTDQIVVPKEAVVLRMNREVIFTYDNGIAKWNYVQIGSENSSYYTIQKGIKEQDTIIIGGNLNLAHNAKVKLVELLSEY